MRLIDADARVTVYSFDEEHEEYDHTEMSVEEALDFATDEGCPPVIETTLVEQWISVKDRLPREDVYVLAYNGVALFIAAHTTNPSNRWYAISGFTIYATHWMPLPELPKEDNDAE